MAYGNPTKSGSPPCSLYLITPPEFGAGDFTRALRQIFLAINASEYEKNSHILEFRPASPGEGAAPCDHRMAARALAEIARAQGIVFVCRADAALAKEAGADGVLLDKAEDVAAAKEILGDDAVIGVRCGSSRRAAEQALEAGADYVSFYREEGGLPNPEIVRWWKLKTGAPCLVEGPFTNDDCGFYAAAGADFIDGSAYVWNHPEGVMKGVVNMAYAIELALDAAKERA
jgi:thiamine-phosphate pyrophosphorylase